MALEELITKLTVALDANTAAVKAAAAGGGGSTAATTTKAAATAGKAKAVDFDTVKVAATKLMEVKGRPFAKKLILDVGGAKELSGVKPDKFAALLKAFESALSETDASEEAEDDDEL